MKKQKVVLSFPPEKVEDPIIYHLIKDYDLMVSILRATIDPGKQGLMVVELSGANSQLSHGINVPICPTSALDVDRESWVVSFNPDKCVVCLSCVDVCVYNAVQSYL
ncbi:MAG: 4Fe-4S binding protein [Deltaproteobacteria bacterium]|nr:4Fe-4S binding protein [Deltaproteobacteria bacterium]